MEPPDTGETGWRRPGSGRIAGPSPGTAGEPPGTAGARGCIPAKRSKRHRVRRNWRVRFTSFSRPFPLSASALSSGRSRSPRGTPARTPARAPRTGRPRAPGDPRAGLFRSVPRAAPRRTTGTPTCPVPPADRSGPRRRPPSSPPPRRRGAKAGPRPSGAPRGHAPAPLGHGRRAPEPARSRGARVVGSAPGGGGVRRFRGGRPGTCHAIVHTTPPFSGEPSPTVPHLRKPGPRPRTPGTARVRRGAPPGAYAARPEAPHGRSAGPDDLPVGGRARPAFNWPLSDPSSGARRAALVRSE